MGVQPKTQGGARIGYFDGIEQGLVVGPGGRVSLPRGCLDKSLLAQLRIIDEQDAIQSINWDFLPYGLPQDLVEQIIYYRGTGCLFRLRANDQFYFLPYVGHGLDCYGRFTEVTPVVWHGSAYMKDEKAIAFIPDLKLKPIYDVIPRDQWKPSMMYDCCVILYDYTPQASNSILSRQALNEPLLQTMSEMIPFLRTSLSNSVGISGMKITSDDEEISVREANNASIRASLRGDKWIGIKGSPALTDLAKANGADAQPFITAYQSLENLRLATHGVDGGGFLNKSAHLLQAEQSANALAPKLIMDDRIYQRQKFAGIADTLWPIGLDVYPADTVAGYDANMDGNPANLTPAEDTTKSLTPNTATEETNDAN